MSKKLKSIKKDLYRIVKLFCILNMNMFKFRPVTMTVKRLGIWALFIETTGHHSLSHYNVKIMNVFLFILSLRQNIV